MDTVQIKALPRLGKGKEAARKERQRGLVPAVVYGNGQASRSFAFDPTDLERTLDRGVGRNAIFEIDLGDQRTLAVLRETQRHPIRPGLLHVDFFAVKADGMVDVKVPVRLVGTPEGVKLGGKLNRLLRVATLRCPVAAIPVDLAVDVSGLRTGQKTSLDDVTAPENTEIISRYNLPIASVSAMAEEEEEGEEEEAEGVVVEEPSDES